MRVARSLRLIVLAQHRERPCVCEQTRMVNIAQSLGMPTFYLRYNPDPYRKPLERRRFDHESSAIRLERLKFWLDYTLQNSPATFGDHVRVMYLFYDGYNDGETPHSLVKLEKPVASSSTSMSVQMPSSSTSYIDEDSIIIEF